MKEIEKKLPTAQSEALPELPAYMEAQIEKWFSALDYLDEIKQKTQENINRAIQKEKDIWRPLKLIPMVHINEIARLRDSAIEEIIWIDKNKESYGNPSYRDGKSYCLIDIAIKLNDLMIQEQIIPYP